MNEHYHAVKIRCYGKTRSYSFVCNNIFITQTWYLSVRQSDEYMYNHKKINQNHMIISIKSENFHLE